MLPVIVGNWLAKQSICAVANHWATVSMRSTNGESTSFQAMSLQLLRNSLSEIVRNSQRINRDHDDRIRVRSSHRQSFRPELLSDALRFLDTPAEAVESNRERRRHVQGRDTNLK